ncbi:hypothetical protein [uncultured Thiodictyon sp.]|uniref:hypothetical protein n=1 Tax=uncultured Thiodictyon sp. TaxID=1846217 RepID=UPI0025D3F0E8|nr:hypothetical protein [uncultured Thiodictyon sp.]
MGEYARDVDGDGVYEVHVNTMEGFRSLLRSLRRPHRGIAQEELLLYLEFFSVHTKRPSGRSGAAPAHALGHTRQMRLKRRKGHER